MLLKLDLEQEKLDAKITGLILLILDRRSPGGIPKFTNRTVDPGGWNWSRVSSFGSAIQAVAVHVECERTCNDGKILCTVVNSALPLLCILLAGRPLPASHLLYQHDLIRNKLGIE